MTSYPPPGPELDALVADRVMGIARHSQFIFGSTTSELVKVVNVIKPPPYSTDIAAAWEVAERLAAMSLLDSEGELLSFTIAASPIGWEVGFQEHTHDGPMFVERLSVRNFHHAPHAICLAALKAVGA